MEVVELRAEVDSLDEEMVDVVELVDDKEGFLVGKFDFSDEEVVVEIEPVDDEDFVEESSVVSESCWQAGLITIIRLLYCEKKEIIG